MRILFFVKKQIFDIKKGGYVVLLSKVIILLKNAQRSLLYLILSPIILLILFFIRIIRPIILIRWMPLSSHRIGHFALNTELYLCEQKINSLNKTQRIFDIFYLLKPVSNIQLSKMWSRLIRIWPAWIIEPINLVNKCFKGREKHEIENYLRAERGVDTLNLLDKFPPHLEFTPSEEEYGYKQLQLMGIKKEDPFVCLILRDAAYLKSQFSKFRNSYFHYHNYRDVNIEDYYPVCEYLSKLNYFVLRMGAKVEKRMMKINDKVIDYATNGMRSDFMDIFLCAKCSFVISSSTGLDMVANIFRKDCVKTNFVPITITGTSTNRNLYIYKHHVDKKTKKKLTFSQIKNKNLDLRVSTEIFEKRGVVLNNNSPQEILDVTKEKIDRLNNNWKTKAEDEELQKKFWTLFPIHAKNKASGKALHGKIKSRVGTEFLKQNKNFLQ